MLKKKTKQCDSTRNVPIKFLNSHSGNNSIQVAFNFHSKGNHLIFLLRHNLNYHIGFRQVLSTVKLSLYKLNEIVIAY